MRLRRSNLTASTGSHLQPTRLRLSDLIGESSAGILQRPARTVLTALGTTLGVGAFVAILGLTSTASGQISADFSVLAATQVTINDAAPTNAFPAADDPESTNFPADADAVVGRLNGVVHAGRTWAVAGAPQPVSTTFASTDSQLQIPIDAGSVGYLQSLDPTVGSGVLLDTFHEQSHAKVAVLGAAAAQQLGITTTLSAPAIFVDGTPFIVIGIISDVRREPAALLSIFIPTTTAIDVFGQPTSASPESMLIETKLGAAPLVARQAPIALRPDDPQSLQAIPPPNPRSLQDKVINSLDRLFLVLAAVALSIGAVGIANTTLVAVIERRSEIGLRRARGARGRHIAGQFLTETVSIGTVGGLVGTAVGVAIVISVALAQSWTAVLDPVVTLVAPLLGTATGLVAGIYPALRAARIEPLEALRR